MLGFLSKNPSEMIFFDGDANHLENCFDSDEGIAYDAGTDVSTWTDYNFTFYGRKATVKVPFLPVDVASKIDHRNIESSLQEMGIEDQTKRITSYINNKAKKDLISDIEYGKWNEIFSSFMIVKYNSQRCLLQRQNRNFLQFKQGDSEELTLLTMLEFMQGFVRLDPIKFSFQKTKQDLDLGKNWVFETTNKKYIDKYKESKIIVNHNYTINLRRIMFYDQFKQFENSGLLQSWQYKVIKYMAKLMYFVAPRRSGKSYVLAYIALRELFMQSFKPEVRERPLTVLYLSLNKGLNLQIKRYMDKMIQRMGQTEEQRRIFKEMLVWDNQNSTYQLKSNGDVIGQIIFLTAQGDDPGIGYPGDVIIIDEMFKIPREHKEGLDAICDGEDARFFGASTMYKDSTKGRAWEEMTRIEGDMGDLRSKNDEIVDMRGQEHEVKNYMDSNTSMPRSISFKTLASKDKRETQDKLDYQELINNFWETTGNVCIRFTIDDIDRHVKSGRAERWKKKYLAANDYLRYVTELYSRFPHEGAVFKYRNSLRDPAQMSHTGCKFAVLAHDPALSPETADKAACVLVTYDQYNNKLCVNKSESVVKTGKARDAAKGIMHLAKLRDSYGQNKNPNINYDPFDIEFKANHNMDMNAGKNLHIVGDATANQKSTWELYNEYGLHQHCTISYRGIQMAKQSRYDQKNRDVSKKEMVEIVKEVIDNGWLWINSDLMPLRKELNAFQRVGDTNEYEGIGDTDDEVNAMIIGIYYLYKILNVKTLLTQDRIPNMTPNMDKEEKKRIGRLLKAKKDMEEKQKLYRQYQNEFYNRNVY